MTNSNAKRGEDRRIPPAPIVRAPVDWKPEPCGLTREQLRAIIIEQIG